jgi:hypothetical protein
MLEVIVGFSCVEVVGDDDWALQALITTAHTPINTILINFINITFDAALKILL